MTRRPGLSVRARLALSYAAVVVVTGTLLLAAVWVFLLRYVPDQLIIDPARTTDTGVFPVRTNLLREFAPRAAVVLLLLLLLGLAAGWVLAGRMLAPLARITDATRRAAAGALDHRIHLPGRADELTELADAFDGMLARLEAHVAQQRRFAANASHELRTPLAITRTVLDVARAEGRGDPELVDRLQAVNARAVDLTEALLLLSRADGGAVEREPVDLALVLEDAVETLLPLADARGVVLETAGGAATAAGTRALLLQLATTLLHNAIVHNLPAGGTARVAVGRTGDRAVLSVENTGAPLDAALVATLAEPFRRGEDRTRDGHAGVGLGLAIAASIARAHGGTLVLAPRPGGGLLATAELPAYDPARAS